MCTKGGHGHTSVLITSAVMGARPLFARLEYGAGGHQAGGHKTPQRDHELACHRHDGDTAYPALHVADTLAEPLAQFAVGLMLQPQPGQLDGNRTRTSIAGFADALLAPALATVVGRPGKPSTAPRNAFAQMRSSSFTCWLAKHSRACSRTISSLSRAGNGRPSPVRILSRLAMKFRCNGVMSRMMPCPCSNPLMRLLWAVHSCPSRSRSRIRRLRSSSSGDGTCNMLQTRGSPRK